MLDWSDINSSAGAYQFAHLDAFVALNQARYGCDLHLWKNAPVGILSTRDARSLRPR